MEIIKSIKKNTILILLITIIVIYAILKDNLHEIVATILEMNYFYVIIAIILYFASLSIKAYVAYKCVNNKEKLTIRESIKHNIITQFFNGITPFYTGGQPMEVYMLTKHGISASRATSIVVQNFIFYQTALVLLGTLAVLYNFFFQIFPSTKKLKNLILLSFTINIIVLIALYMVILCKKKIKDIMKIIIHLLCKLKIIKNEEKNIIKWSEKIDEFHNSSKELRKQKTLFIKGVILNFLSLICLYIIPLFIAYGLNEFNSLNAMDALVTSAYVLIIGAFIPAPGSSGGIEYGFIKFFGNFFPVVSLNASLLIWRFITYYLGMFVGAILINFDKKEV